jgi:hypothetical protein
MCTRSAGWLPQAHRLERHAAIGARPGNRLLDLGGMHRTGKGLPAGYGLAHKVHTRFDTLRGQASRRIPGFAFAAQTSLL